MRGRRFAVGAVLLVCLAGRAGAAVQEVSGDAGVSLVEVGEVTEHGETRPILQTQEVETHVLIKDGETIVIGGLIKDKKSSAGKKIPILGDIPFLGFLFRKDTDETIKQDLLIFITGRVMKPGMMGVRPHIRLDDIEREDRLTTEEARDRSIRSHFARGMRYYRTRKYRQSIGEFNRVLEPDPLHGGAQEYIDRAEK